MPGEQLLVNESRTPRSASLRAAILWCGAAAALAPRLAAQEPARDGVPPSVDFLIAALTVADERIRSVEWEQQVRVIAPGGDWVVMEESRQGFDDSLDWYCHRRWGHWEDAGPVGYDLAHYLEREERVWAYNPDPDARNGLLRPPNLERLIYVTLEELISRRLDESGRRTLPELLRDADHAVVLPSDRPGEYRLRAWMVLNWVPAYIDVWLDPAKGWVPTRMEYRHALLHHPVEIRDVTEWTCHSGVWLPKCGVRRQYFGDHGAQDEADRFRTELRAAIGDPEGRDWRDPAVVEGHRRAIAAAFGDRGVPTRPLGVGVLKLDVTRIVSVNRPLDAARAAVPYPPGYRVMNAFTRVMQDADGRVIEPVPRAEEPPR